MNSYLAGDEYGYDQININYNDLKDSSAFLNTNNINDINTVKNREERLFSKMDKYFTKNIPNQRNEDIKQMMCNKHTYPRINEQCTNNYIPNLFRGNNKNILPEYNANSRRLGIMDGMVGSNINQITEKEKEKNNMLYLLIFLLIIIIIIQYHKYSNDVKFIMIQQVPDAIKPV